MAFANLVLRTRTFSQTHYNTAAKGALVDSMLYFTIEYQAGELRECER
jgi:hypothetical protein